MELIDDRPTKIAFTATQATRIVSEDGAMCVMFEAGETITIQRDLFTVATAAGLVPEAPLEAPPKEAERKSREEKVKQGLIEACKTLILRGNPKDFLISGQPRAASVKKIVDFQFTNKDVERAFSEAIHEVEHHGDDRKEHSESSSSTAA